MFVIFADIYFKFKIYKMKIEKFKHAGVNPDGTFKSGAGSVETAGKISMSGENGGCGMPSCKCSPGFWISVSLPLRGSTVEGIRVNFDNKKEMEEFMKYRQLICQTKKK